MAFKFRFAAVLRLSIHQEDEVKRALSLKDGQIAEQDKNIQKVLQEENRSLQSKSEALKRGDMFVVRMFPAYMLRLKNIREFHEEEKERLLKQREKILKELTEKRRVRKIYEKLRERDEKKYMKHQQKQDQKRMDEFASRTRASGPASEYEDPEQEQL
ncbi:MAG: flagellar export protein FliJ [Candidatus Riflebacteria bacterium]|nr:flagellar export protein FliJ [Candidatus Riflebacteria bacterium]